ncbi:hypothetical protein Agabi119p4_6918 [Agaricus bisporus var. burnettii]|uniref:RING-type E3 ubiquitin transferase n=1 Tax=Agaricus bisporus var. burnettii TaxID=192524 RepID=A0A8H7KFG9_AGABI|nr:hypothetical protein Agabi119p4_6918 [Agaricus bisporus var. burnettii]
MQDFESELQNPTGISTVKPPQLALSAVLLSKECGIVYEIHSTQTLRSQAFFSKMTTYGALSVFAYGIALLVFVRQVERSRTPSGVSRVSRWTFLVNATIDAVCFAGHITFAILAEGRASLALMATAFLSCILFIQEAQFAALIFQIQGPESTPTPPPRDDEAHASFFRFFIHHVRTDPQARLWIMMFLFLTVLVRVILSPALSLFFVIATYSLIWFPQIWRSAKKGRTSGLSAEYVFGTTFCRLAGALYFLTCPNNVLDVQPRDWAHWFALGVIFQACIIMLQERFGASFFLPHKYRAVVEHDYHPLLPLPDAEAPEKSLGDCSICMEPIYVNPSLMSKVSQGQESGVDGEGVGGGLTGSASGFLMHMGVGGSGRKEYSLAPCHHLFHTDCLEKWIAIKTICPQCRRSLPPL